MEFTHPSQLLQENKGLVVFAIILLSIGFYLGTKPQFKEIVLGQPKEDAEVYRNVFLTTSSIWRNNAWISLQASFGIISAFQVAIFSVGIVYGALFVTMPLQSYLSVLAAFGILELIAVFLSIFAGLLFLKGILLKLKREQISLVETILQAFFVFLFSVALLIPAALIEAILLYSAYFNPQILTEVLIGGTLISAILVYLTLKKRE